VRHSGAAIPSGGGGGVRSRWHDCSSRRNRGCRPPVCRFGFRRGRRRRRRRRPRVAAERVNVRWNARKQHARTASFRTPVPLVSPFGHTKRSSTKIYSITTSAAGGFALPPCRRPPAKTMSGKSSLEVSRLIAEVHRRPELWDRQHPQHHNRSVLDHHWESVASMLGIMGKIRLEIINFNIADAQ